MAPNRHLRTKPFVNIFFFFFSFFFGVKKPKTKNQNKKTKKREIKIEVFGNEFKLRLLFKRCTRIKLVISNAISRIIWLIKDADFKSQQTYINFYFIILVFG